MSLLAVLINQKYLQDGVLATIRGTFHGHGGIIIIILLEVRNRPNCLQHLILTFIICLCFGGFFAHL